MAVQNTATNRRTSTVDAGASRANGSARSARADLFPLPMTPWEYYMWLDDRPGYPMAFTIALELSGEFDLSIWRAACVQALARHPLLSCRLERRGWNWCWVRVGRIDPQFDVEDAGVPLLGGGEPLDLRRFTGLRVWIRRSRESTRITVQFHHACCDGLGAVQFLGDWLALYGLRTGRPGQDLPELTGIQIERLRDRQRVGLVLTTPAPGDSKKSAKTLTTIRKLWKLVRRQPVPLAVPAGRQPGHVTDLAFPSVCPRWVDRTVVRQVRDTANRGMASANDVYLRAMFETLAEWNRIHAGSATTSDQWLRIGLPLNMRTPMHDGMPATNIVSYMFLTRQVGQVDRPNELLAEIHRQTENILNERQGRFLLSGLKHLQRVPGLMSLILRNPCAATVILANVGDIRRQFTAQFPLEEGRCVAGNVVLESVEGAAPVRPGTRAAVSLGMYAGKLSINMHCDPRSFTQAEADRLADLFIARIHAAAEVPAAHSASGAST